MIDDIFFVEPDGSRPHRLGIPSPSPNHLPAASQRAPYSRQDGAGRDVAHMGMLGDLSRIAIALEAISSAYQAELAWKGVNLNLEAEGEGEILVTDDADVAARIERIILNGTNAHNPGFFLQGEPEGIPAPTPGTEVQAGWEHPALFGSFGGFNVGPEGAEESGSGPPSLRGPGGPTPGDVHRQGSSEEPEG